MSKYNSKALGKKLNKLGFILIKRTDCMAGDYWLVENEQRNGWRFFNVSLKEVYNLYLCLQEQSTSPMKCSVDYNTDTERWECHYDEDSHKQSLDELTAISQNVDLYKE